MNIYTTVKDVEKELDTLEIKLNAYTRLRNEMFRKTMNSVNVDTEELWELSQLIDSAKISSQRICKRLREQIKDINKNKRFNKLIKEHNFEVYSKNFKY